MAVAYHPLPSEVLEAHALAVENYKWIRDELESIRKNYPNEFIAVANREIVYHTKVYTELLKYVAKHRNLIGLVTSRTDSPNSILLR